MKVIFEGYVFEIQINSKVPRLMCITSEKKFKGVVVPLGAPTYVIEAMEHVFFTRSLYDGHNVINESAEMLNVEEGRKNNYKVFKNIISDIASCAGGVEFLRGLMRYIEYDKATFYINKALGEVLVGK